MTIANSAQRDNWNGEGGQAWVADADHRDAALAGVSEHLLRGADPRSGETVLDIGCGCGATSFAAARIVGPYGAVRGFDISDVMLAVARERATASRLANVTFTRADVQTHKFEPASHDLAISRFGTMFFDDSASAFSNVAGALRPGGRLCITTWQPMAKNDWLTIPNAVLQQYGTLPELSQGPGMFAQSDASVLTELLHTAGFTNIEIQRVTVPMTLGETAEKAAAYVAGSGIGRAVLSPLSPEHRQAAVTAVGQTLAEHQGPHGVVLDGAILVTTATVPAVPASTPGRTGDRLPR